jgi:hypothetical protein
MIDDSVSPETNTEEDTSENDVHPTDTVRQAAHLERCERHFDMVKGKSPNQVLKEPPQSCVPQLLTTSLCNLTKTGK